jgi:hypothetical protein
MKDGNFLAYCPAVVPDLSQIAEHLDVKIETRNDISSGKYVTA